MKKWGLKIIGVVFTIVSLPMIFQGEIGAGVFGLLLGICLFLLPEKYNEIVYRYIWLVISWSVAFMLKLIDSFFKLFNKGAEKTSQGLNSISNRAAGNKTIKCPRCKSLNVTFFRKR